jgi:signal transduction histidine kinase
MRSLALKLALAFLVVGLVGAGLVAFFVGRLTQSGFNQFVLDSYELDIRDELAQHYQTYGNWDNVQAALIANPRRGPGNRRHGWIPVAVLDANNVVVVAGGTPYQPGDLVSPEDLERTLPIEVEGEVVGRVLLPEPGGRTPPAGSPESRFLLTVRRAILFSALAATIVALLLGLLLARTISGPLRELTQATHLVAQGDVGHEVPVRTQDEIGELATSFNRMSTNLARANQLRRQMTADIAHDLRTPTSVLMGYTEALSDGKLQGTPEMYRVMHEEAQHLNHLINDLRTLSLADAGELPLMKQEITPQTLLERAAAAHSIQANNQQTALHVESTAGLPPLKVDPDRMAQVLDNLVGNALRHTPPGGRITLSAGSADGHVMLKVQDTGSGIAPEDLPYVFNRFYRGDKSRAHNGASGLGLAIARSIVEIHRGTITAESAPGRGTTITITLPVLP